MVRYKTNLGKKAAYLWQSPATENRTVLNTLATETCRKRKLSLSFNTVTQGEITGIQWQGTTEKTVSIRVKCGITQVLQRQRQEYYSRASLSKWGDLFQPAVYNLCVCLSVCA